MASPFCLQMEKPRPTFNLYQAGMALAGHFYRQGLVAASQSTCAIGVESPSLQARKRRPEKLSQGRTGTEAGMAGPGPVLYPLCGLAHPQHIVSRPPCLGLNECKRLARRERLGI